MTGYEIRESPAEDLAALQRIYAAAFPQEELLPLVETLLAEVPELLSLAAVEGEELLGHLLFTPCEVAGRPCRVALLGPLAVTPARQRQGIGGALLREGLRRLRGKGFRLVLVLGDPAYYGRFGFEPETGLSPPYDLPRAWADAWRSLPLDRTGEPCAGRLVPPRPWLDPVLWSDEGGEA